MPDDVIDEKYLRISAEKFRKDHFAPTVGPSDGKDPKRHSKRYEKSAQRYRSFLGKNKREKDRIGIPVEKAREPCQIEKDDRFWVAACLTAMFYGEERSQLFAEIMRRAFERDDPPFEGFGTWEECFAGDLHLFFEVNLPAPQSYKAWLQENVEERLLVPHLRHAARSAKSGEIRKDLEGPTHVDAMLIAENGVTVIFEAKVLSDTSHDISFDPIRNQIVRNVDVMLETPNENAPAPLDARDPQRTLFVLLTPSLFRDRHRRSRLYGSLMDDYRNTPSRLGKDLEHRRGVDWQDVAARMGWLTWEECEGVLPGSCPWLFDAAVLQRVNSAS